MDANKPKVGWAYRYRISRYLDAQKMKRTGNKNRIKGGGKTKQIQQNNHKKTISSSSTKIAKRKLLEYNGDEDDNNDEQITSNDNTLSSSSKINRDLLRKNISQHVHATLKPYTKRTCKQGRIVSTDDIKYLVKKFTLAVLDK